MIGFDGKERKCYVRKWHQDSSFHNPLNVGAIQGEQRLAGGCDGFSLEYIDSEVTKKHTDSGA